MPLLGGLAVGAAFAVGLTPALAGRARSRDRALRGLVLGGAVILVTGIVDDRFGLDAWKKLTGQLLAAGIAIAFGFRSRTSPTR